MLRCLPPWPSVDDVKASIRAAVDASLSDASEAFGSSVVVENNQYTVPQSAVPQNGIEVEVVHIQGDVVRVKDVRGLSDSHLATNEYEVRKEGLTENHLLLGITYETACLFLRMLRWPETYQRCVEGRCLENLSWVAKQLTYPNTKVGYDLVVHIRTFFRQRHYDNFSVAQVMRAVLSLSNRCGKAGGMCSWKRRAGVRWADAFLSHVQLEEVSTTLRALKRARKAREGGLNSLSGLWFGQRAALFVDYLCLKQCQTDFKMERIESAIRRIGRTIVLLDPLTHIQKRTFSPDVPNRAWCIFEIYCTWFSDKPLEGSLSRSGLMSAKSLQTFHVDINAAFATNSGDMSLILDRIRLNDGIGKGVNACNACVGETIGEAFHHASIYGSATIAVPALITMHAACIILAFGRRYAEQFEHYFGEAAWLALLFATAVFCIIASKFRRESSCKRVKALLLPYPLAICALLASIGGTCLASFVYGDLSILASAVVCSLTAILLAFASVSRTCMSCMAPAAGVVTLHDHVRLGPVVMPDSTFRLLCLVVIIAAVMFLVGFLAVLFIVGVSKALPLFGVSVQNFMIVGVACYFKKPVSDAGEVRGRSLTDPDVVELFGGAGARGLLGAA